MASLLNDGSWEIQGRRLGFPVHITDATAAAAVHLVRTPRAARLVAGTRFEPVSVAGRTPLFLFLVHYAASDLGAYDEVGVALLVRHRGRTGVYVHQLPVTGEFTMEAGRALWGLPKWRAGIELQIAGAAARCDLADAAGHPVLTAAIRTLPWPLPLPIPAAFRALAPLDDEVLVSPVRGRASGVRVGLGGGTVVPGSGHPMADELRALGLPGRALATVTVEHLVFEMDRAQAGPR